jgi:hypothetical protein
MAMELALIPSGTRVEANGDGATHEISSSATRTFLCVLDVLDQIEQEALDVSVWASPDGLNWGTKPIIKLPQQFYRGESRMVLDLTLRPEMKFVRAKWEVNRWGRVAPLPMFVIGLRAIEMPAMPRSNVTIDLTTVP